MAKDAAAVAEPERESANEPEPSAVDSGPVAAAAAERVPALDGVRGLAVLLVLLWHSVGGYAAFNLTWSGVDLFFVLSGFLITGILLDNKKATNFFTAFYVRRVARIFPLYYLHLALFLAFGATSLATEPRFAWLMSGAHPIWSYATFTQNILMGTRESFGCNWLGITWSVAIEEQFYLLVPALVFLLPRGSLLATLLCMVLAAPVLRTVFPGWNAFVNLPWRADSLLWGACLAVLIRWTPFVEALRRNKHVLHILLGAFLVGAVIMSGRGGQPTAFGAFSHTWLAALYGTLVLIAHQDGTSLLGRGLALSPFVWLGRLSYGIYMFHEVGMGLLHGLLRDQAPRLVTSTDGLVTALALVLGLGLSALSYRFVEQPILRRARRVAYEVSP
jgi:peptidoglycan/LPS O-acetylase OafA/YrhL